MEKFIIIDGNSLINRAFYALPLLSNDNGEFSNAVYGFTNILTRLILEEKPEKLCVAFDYGKKTFRHNIYADYKGGRKSTPEELKSQFPLLKTLLGAMNIKMVEKEGIEADDIIGTMVQNKKYHNIIVSGDKDLLQLINGNTEVWLTKKGISETLRLNETNIKEEIGVTPSQVVDLKSLQGDASDNIPGVQGIGEKTAKLLLDKYASLKNIYSNISNLTGSVKNKLEEGKDSAEMSFVLATIKTDCELNCTAEECSYSFPWNENVANICAEFNFGSILKRKELFANAEEKNNVKELEIIEITERSQFKDIAEEIKKHKRLAFNFKNETQLYIFGNTKYVLKRDVTLWSNADENDLFEFLLPLLADETIEKVTYDLKSQMHILKSNKVINCFDIALADYLENTKISSHGVENYFEDKKKLLAKMEETGMTNLYYEMEYPLTFVLYSMENNGIFVDKKELLSLNQEYSQQLLSLEQQIYDFAGKKFNIKSPKQLAQVLFVDLSLFVPNNKKQSTDISILEELVGKHPIIEPLIKYRKLCKLMDTYVQKYVELTQQSETIHTLYNQTLTSTGRLSSSEPNLQNIPVRDEEGKKLRKMFISRFANGEIISADYNQIELRLLACFSGDKELVQTFKEGNDIHAFTASQILGKPQESITKEERRLAKAVNFGIIYGISDYGLAQNIDISRSDAKKYIEKYFERYPTIKDYLDDLVKSAKEKGYASTLFGRRRNILEITSANFSMRSFGERVAKNMPLQGSASDIIKLAMIEVDKSFKEENLESKLIVTIHDELVVDTFPNEITRVKEILKANMENVVALKVPLTVEISEGHSLYDC